jgi:hypothetical protein
MVGSIPMMAAGALLNPPKLFKLLELGVGVREGEVNVPGDVRIAGLFFVRPSFCGKSGVLLGHPEPCCCSITRKIHMDLA